MTAEAKLSMLQVLEDLAANPHWESLEWVRAVTLATQDAMQEVGISDPDLATRLFIIKAAVKLSDRQQALTAILNSHRIKGHVIGFAPACLSTGMASTATVQAATDGRPVT